MVTESRLLLRQISKETFTTYLGDVEYMRVDILSDLERVRKRHTEQARASNFDDCGCDYCEALSPLVLPSKSCLQ